MKLDNKIYNCDNREVFLKLRDNSIDMILTDPPYKDYQSNRPVLHSKVKKIHESDFDLPFFIAQSARVLKPGGHFYCWCDHYTFPEIYNEILNLREIAKVTTSTDSRVKSRVFLHYKNCLIWIKNNHGSGDLRGNYAPQHELVIFACKGPKGRPLNGKRPSNVLFKRTDSGIEFFKRVSNYKYQHGTSKPVEILEQFILSSTDPGEIVFDPYAGSMSTGEACILNDRKYLLVEIDGDFYNSGLERLNKVTMLKEKLERESQ
ncbi:MAG: site-specific DNA-methyltransferase [Calditrichaeota bacterium]|nr:site-specific DNA-methyltransferase [Calditrichota bacterium]MBT7787440.1 site-specific DNA-methyltransferase [Calditrichota bacterium]